MKWVIVVILVGAGAFALKTCGFFAGKLPTSVAPVDGLSGITLPPGFRIEVFAENVPGARSMTPGPDGAIYVGTRSEGKVYAVRSVNDKKNVITIAKELSSPNGIAYADGSLYVAEISRVLRFDDVAELQGIGKFNVVNDSFPSDEDHGWKFIAFGPDGKLYVPVGMPCNICEPTDGRYGSIMRMNRDGSGLEVFARGVRNTVGFDWHPSTKELWFTDNGRDWLGENLPPDELNFAPRQGMHFGFPYAYGKNHQDPEFQAANVDTFSPAALELGPHVAALGMRFYDGAMFPSEYQGGIFIAEHGSWNRTVPLGYRVMFVRIEGNKPVSYEVFAEGWLQNMTAWGRPVDVEVLPDGSLLISDDKAGAIYRVTFVGVER